MSVIYKTPHVLNLAECFLSAFEYVCGLILLGNPPLHLPKQINLRYVYLIPVRSWNWPVLPTNLQTKMYSPSNL